MIAILDYDAGNIKSVEKAVHYLGEEAVITRDKDLILSCDKVILPGVGSFGDAMGKLREYKLDQVIYDVVDAGTPFLGICLGLQLLYKTSEESPGATGLGILDGEILRIPDAPDLKVPQIGWNSLDITPGAKLFAGVEEHPYVYFVHSYYLKSKDEADVAARTHYSVDIHASVEKGNVFACQGNQICPSGNIDTYDIAKKLDARYYARELPHKFKFGVTGCQNNCLKAEENDVGIKGACVVSYDEPSCIMCGVCVKACRENAITIEDGKLTLDTSKCNYCGRCAKACPTEAWKGESGYLVSFGGLFGNQICKGESFLPVITSEEQLFRVTDAAIQFFDDYANPSERFRFTLERVGIDKFKEVIKEAYNG